jgi:hypothetical protein
MNAPITIYVYDLNDLQLKANQIDGYAKVNLFSRNDLFVRVSKPDEAMFILLPIAIDGVLESNNPKEAIREFFKNLQFYAECEHKHVFFSFHDYSDAIDSNAIFFRASVRRSIATSTTFAFPYDIHDVGTTLEKIEYHTTFVGATSTNSIRIELKNVLQNSKNLQFYCNTVDTFHEKLSNEEEQKSRKKLYIDAINTSVTVCCPKGNGVQSKRFFEVLSMGRIPILISDDVLLPFEEKIEYSKAIIRIDEGSISQIEKILAPFFIVNKSEDIIERFQYARFCWIEYLQRNKWGELIHFHLRKCLTGFII